MNANLATWALLWSIAAASTANASTTVYRCGPEGRSYSQQPCANGRAVQLQADEPPQVERIAAREQALAAQREAKALERKRLQQDGNAQKFARAGSFGGKPGNLRVDTSASATEARPGKKHRGQPREANGQRRPTRASFKAVVPAGPAAKP